MTFKKWSVAAILCTLVLVMLLVMFVVVMRFKVRENRLVKTSKPQIVDLPNTASVADYLELLSDDHALRKALAVFGIKETDTGTISRKTPKDVLIFRDSKDSFSIKFDEISHRCHSFDGSDSLPSDDRWKAMPLEERVKAAERKAFALLDALEIPPGNPPPEVQYQTDTITKRHDARVFQISFLIKWRDACCGSVSVEVLLSTGRITYFSHSCMTPPERQQVAVSKDEAERTVLDFMRWRLGRWKYEATQVDLTVNYPSNYWNSEVPPEERLYPSIEEPVLCWTVIVSFKQEFHEDGLLSFFYIDAESGEIIGGFEGPGTLAAEERFP